MSIPTKARDLSYGDLFELSDLPPFAEVDDETRGFAEHAYARAQTESYYEGTWLWLDTSFGFFRIDPDLVVDVRRNEPNPFGPRGKS